MFMTTRPALRRIALACLTLAAVAAPASALDDGKLELSYFGDGAVFKEHDDIDYLWVKDGFDLSGKTLTFAEWPDPVFKGDAAEKRDVKDKNLAKMMNNDMADMFEMSFKNAYGDRVTVAKAGADVRVEGRIVDCSTGSTAAKVLVGFGAGSGNTTVDVRFVDAKSGAVLAGMHHRVVSGTTWSTTDSKFLDWIGEVAELMAKKGLPALYDKGKKVKD